MHNKEQSCFFLFQNITISANFSIYLFAKINFIFIVLPTFQSKQTIEKGNNHIQKEQKNIFSTDPVN